MGFRLLYNTIPDPPGKHHKIKPVSKNEDKESIIDKSENSDTDNIRNSVNKVLEYLNGKSHGDSYHTKITPTKNNCFRVIVFSKRNRKVLADFFVEKGGPEEYVFTPPLDISAFTVNSYENRSFSKKNS